ncbi:MAG: hypothetical protein MK132_16285 [Lentisphaerales bacterium]|nr:hypothetical protein [Lentisphaerales bacterium]
MKQAYSTQRIFNRHEDSKENVVFIDEHVGVFQNAYPDFPSSINYSGETMADKHWRLRQK